MRGVIIIDHDQALRDLDPARDAAPPTAEPARYQRLQAAATGQDTHRSDFDPRRSLGSWRLGRRPRPAVFALVAACALAVIAVTAQGLLAPAPSATAAVNAAADRLAAATSGHIRGEWINPEGQQIAVGDFAGANIQFTLSNRYPGQPAKDSAQQFIGIGTHLWVLRQGSWQLQPAEAGGQMYPFTVLGGSDQGARVGLDDDDQPARPYEHDLPRGSGPARSSMRCGAFDQGSCPGSTWSTDGRLSDHHRDRRHRHRR